MKEDIQMNPNQLAHDFFPDFVHSFRVSCSKLVFEKLYTFKKHLNQAV